MSEIRFSTGVQSYKLNDAVEVFFNPTDSSFAERLFETFNGLEKKQESYKAELERLTAQDKSKIFEFMRERDAEMREMIDGVFGVPVCGPLFGTLNVYAMADGLPVWCNLMLSVMDELDSSFAQEQKLTNPRVEKYMAKYKKYQK